MVNCGNTGAIPDCLEAQDDIWTLRYNVPIPGYVRYRYPGENWVNVIGGVRYQIDKISQPGQGVGVLYRVGVYTECEMRVPRTINDCPGQLLNPKVFLASRRFDVYGPIGAISFTPWQQGTLCHHLTDFGNYGRFNVVGQNGTVYGLDTGLNYFRSTEPTTFMECIANEWVGTRFFYKFKPVKSFIERADGRPEPDRWRFQVFDADNNVLFNREDTSQPEAAVIPCQLDPNNERTLEINPQNISFGRFLKGLLVNPTFTLDGLKGTRVEIVPYPLPNVPSRQTILDLYSPKSCTIHPKVCWECNGCKDKKCPPNTCLKCFNPVINKICCYGANGTVIAYADPKCEQADC